MSPLRFPALAEERLANGAALVVARRPGVPLTAVRLLVAAGSAHDPASRHGLAHLVAVAARRGTRRRSRRALEEAAENLGAELGSACDDDSSTFGLSAPAEYLPRLLDLVVEAATEPAFPGPEVERLRRRVLAGMAHLLDEPAAVADRALLGAVHGDHPYGHPVDGRVAHIRRTRRADLAAFHRLHYAPAATTLVVVGPVDPEGALALGRRRLSRWRPAAAPPPELPAPRPPARAVLVVDKPDLTQTQIRIGCAAFPRRSPLHFASLVANAAFGGGFTSRLVEAVRVNRGLSYGVRSRFSASRAGGLFAISSFTKNETAGELVEVALAEAERFAAEGPAPDELARAQAWLCGLFPLSLETHDQVAERIADLRLHGLEVSEVTGYLERIRAVDASACREVAQASFPVGRGVVVAVGPARTVARRLERHGPLTVIAARRTV
ncbi:MAG TPA: pitrilysin family protein [Anaeromyxobacteraceae bacterium]